MKKAVLFITAITALAFTSCKKEYTCRCTDYRSGSDLTFYTIEDTRKNADQTCANTTFDFMYDRVSGQRIQEIQCSIR